MDLENYECKLCKLIFQSSFDVEVHVENFHVDPSEEETYNIPVQNFYTESERVESLKVPKTIRDENKVKNIEKQNNTGKKESFEQDQNTPRVIKFTKKGADDKFESIKKTIGKIKAYKCIHCVETFDTTTQLFKHRQKDFCTIKTKNSTFKEKHDLPSKYMQMQLIKKPFKCLYCNQRFKSARKLRDHSVKKHGEKPFQCQFCPKKFDETYYLITHEMTHANDKPFTCAICFKGYTRKNQFNAHRMICTTKKSEHIETSPEL